jgi:hypothetical protein
MGHFRLRFRARRSATWTGFADTFYTLFCNGKVVGTGPTLGHHTLPYLTRWDLAPYLSEGENVLAVEVWYQGADAADADAYRASLVGILESEGTVIPTGDLWKARIASGYHFTRPGPHAAFMSRRLIQIDFRAEPADWQARDYDDSAWSSAVVFQDDHRKFRESPIPALTVTKRLPVEWIDAGVARGDMPVVHTEDVAKRLAAQKHESLLRPWSPAPFMIDKAGDRIFGLAKPYVLAAIPKVDGDYYATCDFGLETSACLCLEIDAEEEIVLDFAYGDTLGGGRVNPVAMEHSFADRLILPPGRRTVRLPHDRGFRYVQLTFGGPAIVHDFHAEEHIYPFDGATRFRCSDATLNAIWDAAVRTMRQCSLTTLVDNARRERQGWGGPDLVFTNRAFFSIFGESRLIAKKLVDFCDWFEADGILPLYCPAVSPWRQGIASHDLWFPAGCWDYIQLSDDRDLASRLLKVAEAVVRSYDRRNAHGLVGDTGGWKWEEWNLNASHDISTWENLLIVLGWQAVARMRDYLQLPGAEEAREQAQTLALALVEKLWHPRHQALAQGMQNDGRLLDFCGQLDNAQALLLDILPEEKRVLVRRFCAGSSGTWPTNRSGWQGAVLGGRIRHDPRHPVVAGSPLASDVCANAMFHLGDAEEAIQYIRYNFGAMLDEGEGTLWENWQIYQHELAANCQSQSFGCAIASTLLERIVRLRMVAPGGRRLRWRPWPERFASAAGTLTTVCGEVKVGWSGDHLSFQVPAGVTLEIEQGDGIREVRGPSSAH